MEWQPIETAPQGEWLLLYAGSGWQLGFYMPSDGLWHLAGLAGPLSPPHLPTHWQHLPDPPALQPAAMVAEES